MRFEHSYLLSPSLASEDCHLGYENGKTNIHLGSLANLRYKESQLKEELRCDKRYENFRVGFRFTSLPLIRDSEVKCVCVCVCVCARARACVVCVFIWGEYVQS